MDKGFINSCDVTDTGSVCFWLWLPVAFVVYLLDLIG